MERFLCRVRPDKNSPKEFIRPLEYASDYLMPLSDHCADIPSQAKEIDGEDDLSWTGWFEEFCTNCETQFVFSGEVIAWIKLDDTIKACNENTALVVERDEAREAQADSKRLDWLDREWNEGRGLNTLNPHVEADSIRLAIDAAMSHPRKEDSK
jgi:hypothetical protein